MCEVTTGMYKVDHKSVDVSQGITLEKGERIKVLSFTEKKLGNYVERRAICTLVGRESPLDPTWDEVVSLPVPFIAACFKQIVSSENPQT